MTSSSKGRDPRDQVQLYVERYDLPFTPTVLDTTVMLALTIPFLIVADWLVRPVLLLRRRLIRRRLRKHPPEWVVLEVEYMR